MELLIVVSIIAILVGIVVVAASQRKGPASHTRIILAAAKGIADEFEVSSGRVVNHQNESTGLYDWSVPRRKNVGTDGRFSLTSAVTAPATVVLGPVAPTETWSATTDLKYAIERFCWAVTQNETCLAMIKSLGEEVFIDADNNDFIELVDGWGVKIKYASHVSWSDSWTYDDYLPEYPRVFFASCGEDGKWGDHRELLKKQRGQAHNASLASQAEDNIYSFEAD
jgi:hypothetical protein